MSGGIYKILHLRIVHQMLYIYSVLYGVGIWIMNKTRASSCSDNVNIYRKRGQISWKQMLINIVIEMLEVKKRSDGSNK